MIITINLLERQRDNKNWFVPQTICKPILYVLQNDSDVIYKSLTVAATNMVLILSMSNMDQTEGVTLMRVQQTFAVNCILTSILGWKRERLVFLWVSGHLISLIVFLLCLIFPPPYLDSPNSNIYAYKHIQHITAIIYF